MHVNFSNWSKMTLELLSNMGCRLLLLGMKTSLIDIVIFRSNIKLVSFILREIHAMGINVWYFRSSLSSLSQVEVHLGIIEVSKAPETQFSIIGNTYDVMSICWSYNLERINRVVVTIFGQTTLLNRLSLCSYIPLQKISWVGSTNYNIRLERIKNSLCNLILTSQS